MIVTVTANPALDVTYHLPHLHVGESQRVPPARVRAGGKGVNVARVLHDQGLATRIVAPVGGASGATFVADLDAAGIPHSLAEVDVPTRTTTAVVTATETTNLNETGAALPAAAWDALVDLAVAALATSTEGPRHVLVVSGSMPPDAPTSVLARLVAAARAAGAACVVDTSGPYLLAAADAGADLLKPNQHELAAAVPSIPEPLAAARALAARSGGAVALSLGPDGLVHVPARGPAHHGRLDRTLAGNTTGAGDAAVAALAVALASASPDWADAVRTATAWSAAAVLHPLAGGLADPAPLLDSVTVTVLPPTPEA